MNQSTNSEKRSSQQHRLLLVILFLYMVLVGGYAVARYSFRAVHGDTTALAIATETMHDEGHIQPTTGVVYQHGFTYQVTSLVLLAVTGLSVQDLQTALWPLIAPLGLGIAAFAFYLQITKNRLTAVLAVFLLLLQADVLFVTLRGSHEKLDWPLMLVALMLLSDSVELPLQKMIRRVLLFYLVVFTMSTINVFFASTFVTALAVSFILAILVKLYARTRLSATTASDTEPSRLFYVSLSCALLVFVSMAYVYPVALSNLRTLRGILEQISALLLSFEIKGNPYGYVAFGWTSPWVYLGLTVYTWLLIILSLIVWIRRGIAIFRAPPVGWLRDNLDWLLYAGFTLQLGISLVVDVAGALGQNMQLRVFPGFTVMAAVILARGLRRFGMSHLLSGKTRQIALAVGSLAVAWFAMASLLKATNEPLLSNKWSFYGQTEMMSLDWTNQHLQSAAVWTGIDGRLAVVFAFWHANQSSSRNLYDAYDFKPNDRYILLSEREQTRATRLGIAMPSVLDWNRVYDNGEVWLYHKRPRTPYQR